MKKTNRKADKRPVAKKASAVKPAGKSAARKSAATARKPGGARKTSGPAARRRMWRESLETRRARALDIVARLEQAYPDARCSLDYRNPFQLLVATILSAQCTDERVNMVTPALFKRYPAAEDLAGARTEELEALIKSTGFFRNKARSLLGMSNALVDRHDGKVPDEMTDLVKLPGVGRKTANVVLGNAFGKAEGVVVDTHVTRVAGRLGLTTHSDPIRIEQDLMKLFPSEKWTELSHLFIYHGRAVCKAPTPRCEICMLNDICPSSRV